MKGTIAVLTIGLMLASLTGCGPAGSRIDTSTVQSSSPGADALEIVSSRVAWTKINSGALLVDVRSSEEFANGHLDNAVNIPHTRIGAELPMLEKNQEREIVLYCGSGKRAHMAKSTLETLGYEHVYNAGGYVDLITKEKL